jgi:hypothetical protein
MEIPFLLNNSPDIRTPVNPSEHWATYELDGEEIDHEPGVFGKVRVHDDYWNIDSEDRQYYNFEVRNAMHIDNAQLDGCYTLAQNKGSIVLLLHAHNTDDIMEWAQDKDVVVITAAIGKWDKDIELWAMREFNYLMEDERNANYSDADHSVKDLNEVVDAYIHRVHVDKEWQTKNSNVLLLQSDWQSIPDIYTLWDKVGLHPPHKGWIDSYLDKFYAKQECNTELLAELRMRFESHPEYKRLY